MQITSSSEPVPGDLAWNDDVFNLAWVSFIVVSNDQGIRSINVQEDAFNTMRNWEFNARLHALWRP